MLDNNQKNKSSKTQHNTDPKTSFKRRGHPKRAMDLTLKRKNIYLLPSRRGMFFLLAIVVIWVLGTNYQNNLALGLSYLLLAIFVVAIFESFRNMFGLHITIRQPHHNFCGSSVGITLQLSSSKHTSHRNIKLGFSRHEIASINVTDTPQEVTLWWEVFTRGLEAPPPVRIWSRFPLQLIHVWAWFNCDATAVVYPKPVRQAQLVAPEYMGGGSTGLSLGSDEFYSLREYQPTDSSRHIAWKQYARGANLMTKTYSDPEGIETWLELAKNHKDLEVALGYLCYWVLTYSEENRRFGVLLPGTVIPPNSGKDHELNILWHLATYSPSTINAYIHRCPTPTYADI
jgi:uncharacterized protein (DUF58 family)